MRARVPKWISVFKCDYIIHGIVLYKEYVVNCRFYLSWIVGGQYFSWPKLNKDGEVAQ